MKILFVCSGNVGRSQMAEGFYNYFTKTNNASSAGTNKSAHLDYLSLPKPILDLMKEADIDISHQKVKVITPRLVNESNQIFVMCEKEICPDFLLKFSNIAFWDIDDPYEKSFEEMRVIRDLIKEKVLSIL